MFYLCLLLLLLVVQPASCKNNSYPVIPQLCQKKVSHATINTALLNIQVDTPMDTAPLVLYLQSEQCYQCDLIPRYTITDNCSVRLDSRWPMRVELKQDTGKRNMLNLTVSCRENDLTMLYKEAANYTIYINMDNNNNFTCLLLMSNDSSDPFIPIYFTIGIGFLLIVVWTIGHHFYRTGYIHRFLCFWSTESMMSDLGTPTNISQVDNSTASGDNSAGVKKERLKSLDTFRGFSIIVMIFVNYGGGKYWFFQHSKWNGLTVADLVFPWFVFMMGTSLAFSFKGLQQSRVAKWKIFLKILKRSITLFLIGLLINSFGVKSGIDFETFRVPGVLQRFAGTYLIIATLHLICSPSQHPNQFSRFAVVRDITMYWPEWIVILAFITIHTTITMWMPVPGCPRGYLGPGGLHDHGQYFNCTGGAAGYIDRVIFGSSHIYKNPTSKEIYESTVAFDPEGLLGTLNSCVICFLGLQAGKILCLHNDWVKRCRRFIIWSLLLAGLGILLCKGSLNDGWIPINKNLWSLSFVLVMSSMAFFLLLVCYLLVDVFKKWSGCPFYFCGMNSIALYCGHEFFSGRAPVYFKVVETHAALLALNLWGSLFWVLVAIYFYYKHIFISV